MCQNRVRRKQRNSGFSLVEVIVSMVLLTIVTLSTMMIFQRMQKKNIESVSYQDGISVGNTILDSIETASFKKLSNEDKVKNLLQGYTILGYSSQSESVTFTASNEEYIADVSISKGDNDVNTVLFPKVDSLNAEDTCVLNLGNREADEINSKKGTDYDEEASQVFINRNKSYIAELIGQDRDVFYTTLDKESICSIVNRKVHIDLNYIGGYTNVSGYITYELDKEKNDDYCYVRDDEREYTIQLPLQQGITKNLYLIYALPEYNSDKITFSLTKDFISAFAEEPFKLFFMAQNSSYITGNVDGLTFDTDAEYNSRLGISVETEIPVVTERIKCFSNSTVIKTKIEYNASPAIKYTTTSDDNDYTASELEQDIKLYNVSVTVKDKDGVNIYSTNGTSVLQ